MTTTHKFRLLEVKDEEEVKQEPSEGGHVLVTGSSADNMIKLWKIFTDKESEVSLPRI